jgi:hypothetical protein
MLSALMARYPSALLPQDDFLHTAGDQALLAEEPFTLLQASGVRCEATGTQSTQGGDNAP